MKRCLKVCVQRGALTAGVTLLLQLVIAASVQAQTTGSIYGRVTDTNGAWLSEAKVTLTHSETNLARTATTDAEGSYNFRLLPAGSYTIAVVSQGFRPYQQQGIELQVQANLRLDLSMEVGTVSDHVTVTAVTPQVETASSTLGKVVEQSRIVDLPLNGRNFLQLGVLQAGVVAPVPGINVIGSGTNNTPGGTNVNFSVNGMRITSNNHLLDGVNNVEPISGAAMIVPSPDSLREFRILTNAYGAEFGRAGGSIVTVLTRSGSNRFHGSVFEFLRNDRFDARNFFAPQAPALKQNQFGGTFGGHFVKDKTFFFGSYEGFRQVKGNPTTTNVPSMLVRQGDFSQEAIKPRDPLKPGKCDATDQLACFPGNKLPIDPVARNILKLYPEPNLDANQWTGAPVATNNRNQFMGRLDHIMLAGDNTLTARYFFDDGSLLIPNLHSAIASAFVLVPGFENKEVNRFQNLLLADTHLFSQKVI